MAPDVDGPGSADAIAGAKHKTHFSSPSPLRGLPRTQIVPIFLNEDQTQKLFRLDEDQTQNTKQHKTLNAIHITAKNLECKCVWSFVSSEDLHENFIV